MLPPAAGLGCYRGSGSSRVAPNIFRPRACARAIEAPKTFVSSSRIRSPPTLLKMMSRTVWSSKPAAASGQAPACSYRVLCHVPPAGER
ncbi:MAG: hypothetical protein ACREOE_11320 [Gemmatimonadales bacterium]